MSTNERCLLPPLLKLSSVAVFRLLGKHYDERCSVHTEGIHQPSELLIESANIRDAVKYQPSTLRAFHLSVRSLRIDVSQYVFVDLGSGKGRVLLLASEIPFARIEGVEFAKDLHCLALENIKTLGDDKERNIILHHMDALDYQFPPENCVIYMYNPFGGRVLKGIIQNIVESCKARPRDIYVIYVNPVQKDLFERAQFTVLTGGFLHKFLDSLSAPTFVIYRTNKKLSGKFM